MNLFYFVLSLDIVFVRYIFCYILLDVVAKYFAKYSFLSAIVCGSICIRRETYAKNTFNDKLCSNVYGFSERFVGAAKLQLTLRGLGYG